MAFPSTIQLDPDSVILTSQLTQVRIAGEKRVILYFVNGEKRTYQFASEVLQRSFFNNILTTLETEAITVNPVKFDTTYNNPTDAGYTPPDITKGCFWFGIGGTFYSWNPDTTAWIPIISV